MHNSGQFLKPGEELELLEASRIHNEKEKAEKCDRQYLLRTKLAKHLWDGDDDVLRDFLCEYPELINEKVPCTCLAIMVLRNNVDMVHFLINQPGIDINASGWTETPLDIAVKNRFKEIIDMLLSTDASANEIYQLEEYHKRAAQRHKSAYKVDPDNIPKE